MKTAVRIFALAIALVGIAAAASAPASAALPSSHLSATANLPAPEHWSIPHCGDGPYTQCVK